MWRGRTHCCYRYGSPNGLGRNGFGRNVIGRNVIGRNGFGRNGLGRDWLGRNGLLRGRIGLSYPHIPERQYPETYVFQLFYDKEGVTLDKAYYDGYACPVCGVRDRE